jgi:CheY-like chemotaxis protein
MAIHPTTFPLHQLLDYVEAAFQPVASERGLEFRVVTARDLPDELTTDESRLRQVLRNLLSNALKFTEQGWVELRVDNAADDELPPALRGRPSIAFRVTDTGIGIADEHLEIIFGAFQQGEGPTARRYGGTGLGLSISREVAQLLGGAITAHSALGEGSSFTLFLPVSSGPVAVPESGAEGRARADGRQHGDDVLAGRLVLVVDDDPRNVFALTEILEGAGMRVLRAEDGRRGIELLTEHDDVDLIIMDVMMPGMDGWSATAAIRRMPRFADVPVIAVTAKAMPGDRAKTLAAGADDHVTKPVDAGDLLARIRSRLSR